MTMLQKSLQLGREYTNIRYSNEVTVSPSPSVVNEPVRGLTLTLSRSTTSLPTTTPNCRGPCRASSDAHLPR